MAHYSVFLMIKVFSKLYLTQISDDSSDSKFLGALEDTLSVWGRVGYVQPTGESTLVAELRCLPEIDVKNRLRVIMFG